MQVNYLSDIYIQISILQGRKWIAYPTHGVLNNPASGSTHPAQTQPSTKPRNLISPKPVAPQTTQAASTVQNTVTNNSSNANVARASMQISVSAPLPSPTMPVNGVSKDPQPLVYYYHPSRYSPSLRNSLPPPNRGHNLGAPSQPIPAVVLPEPYRLPPSPHSQDSPALPAKVNLTPTPWRPLGKPLDTDDFMHMPTLTAQPIRRTPKMMIRQLFGGTQDNIVISVDGNEHVFRVR